jgi:Tol biopolymer transport system component
MVAYVSDAGQDGATPQVWVQQVGGAGIQLTRDMRECAEPSFTPDGTRVIFSAVVDSTRHVYQVPTLGGTPQILQRAARNARYSPDGRCSTSRKVIAYFAAGPRGPELRLRDFERGTDRTIDTWGAASPGFPAISLDGTRIAFGTLVPGPPVRRPVWVLNIAGGEPRLVDEDAGGRPRAWLDDNRVLIETFGSGLNSFITLDVADATTRPLLASPIHRLSNPRLSPDGRWLAFDAATPGGPPSVFVTRIEQGSAEDESGWIRVASRASHAFWSRDRHLLYYLPTTPTVEIRNKVAARAFDLQNGRVGSEELDVMTLIETIVPALLTASAPLVAGDQIIFLLGNYRGDIWIRDIA